VIFSRGLPDGRVAFANFLVDVKCLGVKDAYGKVTGRFSYDDFLGKSRSRYDLRAVTPADARKLVEDAVEFARRAGLPPHPDYAKVRPLFGDVDPTQGTLAVEFGKEGKPLFIAGPYDTPARCRTILHTLERHCGPGGYDFVLPVSRSLSGEFEPREDESEDDFDDEPPALEDRRE
jgi:hypothetical protein